MNILGAEVHTHEDPRQNSNILRSSLNFAKFAVIDPSLPDTDYRNIYIANAASTDMPAVQNRVERVAEAPSEFRLGIADKRAVFVIDDSVFVDVFEDVVADPCLIGVDAFAFGTGDRESASAGTASGIPRV